MHLHERRRSRARVLAITKIDEEQAALEKRKQQIIQRLTEDCPHPVESGLKGKPLPSSFGGFVFLPFLVCKECGYAEELWGSGPKKLRHLESKVPEMENRSAREFVRRFQRQEEQMITDADFEELENEPEDNYKGGKGWVIVVVGEVGGPALFDYDLKLGALRWLLDNGGNDFEALNIDYVPEDAGIYKATLEAWTTSVHDYDGSDNDMGFHVKGEWEDITPRWLTTLECPPEGPALPDCCSRER